ncbi:hypothetical protein [Sphingobacterium sp. MYb388]|uniref:hypothetical protein n=1 Tax=Sphingobacterium sp. MYb388 TaxID=2745437 RepID=UPI0030ADBC5D
MIWYHQETLYLFIGGLFSIILPVIIIFGKQGYKRNEKRAELEKQAAAGNDTIGDIDIWLDTSYEHKMPKFLQLLTEWSLQPLLIIFITTLFTSTGPLIAFFTFIVVSLVILHELWLGKEHSAKAWYQILMLALWIVAYLVISNKVIN